MFNTHGISGMMGAAGRAELTAAIEADQMEKLTIFLRGALRG